MIDPEGLQYLRDHPEALDAIPEPDRGHLQVMLGLKKPPPGWARRMVDQFGEFPLPLTAEELGESPPPPDR